MKKKALTLAIAAALSAPASFAATDSEGMQYTRASEGFYGRIATLVDSKQTKDGKTTIGFDAVRIGVRGTNDMGGGLEGFYRWEANVSNGNGSSFGSGRLANWGVRGGFGQVQVGSFWTADYNWVGANTDLVGVGSGNAGTYYSDDRQGRSSGASVEYTTPDLNGFQGAVRLSTDKAAGSTDTVGLWNLAAKYDIQGFTVAASYNVRKGALGTPAYCPGGTAGVVEPTMTFEATPVLTCVGSTAATGDLVAAAPALEDLKTWSLGLAYAQDNWHVAGWYGVDGYSDVDRVVTTGTGADARNALGKAEDSNTLTLGGKVAIDKVAVFANWQRTDNYLGVKGNKRSYGGVGVGYTFTQQTGVNVSYRLQDFDDQKGAADEAQNYLRLDMYHSF